MSETDPMEVGAAKFARVASERLPREPASVTAALQRLDLRHEFVME